MENNGNYSSFVCADLFQCLLCISSDKNFLSGRERVSFSLEMCALLLGRKRKVRESFPHSVTLTQKIQCAKVVYLRMACSDLLGFFCHLVSICMSVIMTILKFKAFKNFNAQTQRQEMVLLTEYWDWNSPGKPQGYYLFWRQPISRIEADLNGHNFEIKNFS